MGPPRPRFQGSSVAGDKGVAMRVGIDIGGTKVALRLFDESGRILVRERAKTRKHEGYRTVLEDVVRLVRVAAVDQGIGPEELALVGVAAAGQIDPACGSVIVSPNLHWTNVPFRSDLEEALGAPVRIENDVNAATYGEWRFGLERPARDVVGIFLGTGVGGGLILDGRLHRGSSGVGGEVGHITLNPYGYPCRCGNRGCFETYCGGSYVAERAREKLREGYRGTLWDVIEGQPRDLHLGHIEKAAGLGDEYCAAVWEEIVEYLGAGMQTIANLLNPEVIILGGGVVMGTERLVDEARTVMERRAMTGTLAGLRVVKGRLGEDAATMGVAFMDERGT